MFVAILWECNVLLKRVNAVEKNSTSVEEVVQ